MRELETESSLDRRHESGERSVFPLFFSFPLSSQTRVGETRRDATRRGNVRGGAKAESKSVSTRPRRVEDLPFN